VTALDWLMCGPWPATHRHVRSLWRASETAENDLGKAVFDRDQVIRDNPALEGGPKWAEAIPG
jgi:hypothetical protein